MLTQLKVKYFVASLMLVSVTGYAQARELFGARFAPPFVDIDYHGKKNSVGYGRFIVKVGSENGFQRLLEDRVLQEKKLTFSRLSGNLDMLHLYLLRIEEVKDHSQMLNWLNRHSAVETAEFDTRIRLASYPDTEPLLYDQWPLENTEQLGELITGVYQDIVGRYHFETTVTTGLAEADIDYVEAATIYPQSLGSTLVNLFVVDSGVPVTFSGQMDHEDFDESARLVSMFNAPLAIDGDGILADYPIELGDINFATDRIGHGSAVLGIMAADDDAYGMAGVCPNCDVGGIKIFEMLWGSVADEVSYLSWAIAGMARFMEQASGDLEERYVANLSWYSPEDPPSQLLADVLAIPQSADWTHVLLVAAAGNNPFGQPIVSLPASLSDDLTYLMAVSMTDRHDGRPFFAGNIGVEINVAAPGVDIETISYGFSAAISGYPEHGPVTGTSHATPHVSGLAGMLWSTYSELSAQEVRYCIEHGAEKVGRDYPYINGRNVYYGNGRINAKNSLDICADVATHMSSQCAEYIDFWPSMSGGSVSTYGSPLQATIVLPEGADASTLVVNANSGDTNYVWQPGGLLQLSFPKYSSWEIVLNEGEFCASYLRNSFPANGGIPNTPGDGDNAVHYKGDD